MIFGNPYGYHVYKPQAWRSWKGIGVKPNAASRAAIKAATVGTGARVTAATAFASMVTRPNQRRIPGMTQTPMAALQIKSASQRAVVGAKMRHFNASALRKLGVL